MWRSITPPLVTDLKSAIDKLDFEFQRLETWWCREAYDLHSSIWPRELSEEKSKTYGAAFKLTRKLQNDGCLECWCRSMRPLGYLQELEEIQHFLPDYLKCLLMCPAPSPPPSQVVRGFTCSQDDWYVENPYSVNQDVYSQIGQGHLLDMPEKFWNPVDLPQLTTIEDVPDILA